MPVRSSRTPAPGRPRRRTRPQPSPAVAPLLSVDNKHELIAAHAQARQARGQPQQHAWAGYYLGVTASCLVIFSGWWLTVAHGLNLQFHPQQDAAWQIIHERSAALHDRVAPQVQTIQRQLTAPIQVVPDQSVTSTANASASHPL